MILDADVCPRCGGLLVLADTASGWVFQCGTCGHSVALSDEAIASMEGAA